MTIEDWVSISLDIKQHYSDYEGIVVIHGTDTMAYTASALSFMLENLGKTVILTGSQVRGSLFIESLKNLWAGLSQGMTKSQIEPGNNL